MRTAHAPLAAAAAAAVALLAAPAGAAPTASLEDGSATSFELVTDKGRAVVELLVSAPRTGGQHVLRLRVTDASGSRRLAGELASGALVVTPRTTTLRARLGSLPLRVEWVSQLDTYAVSFGHLESGDRGSGGWLVAGTGSVAKVTIGTTRCTGLVRGVTGLASVYEEDAVAPLSRGLGVSTRGLRCQAEPPFSGPLA